MEQSPDVRRENAAAHFRKRIRQRYGDRPGITPTALWDLAVAQIPQGDPVDFRSLVRLSRSPVRRVWVYEQEAGPSIYIVFDHTLGYPLTALKPGWRISTQQHWSFCLPEARP